MLNEKEKRKAIKSNTRRGNDICVTVVCDEPDSLLIAFLYYYL
jgi:hypothetical protein